MLIVFIHARLMFHFFVRLLHVGRQLLRRPESDGTPPPVHLQWLQARCVFSKGFEMNHFTTSKVCGKLYDHCNHPQCSVNNLLPEF